MIGYKSKDDPDPPSEVPVVKETTSLELELEQNLEYNNIVYEVTIIDKGNKKATIEPLMGDGDTLEIDLDTAAHLADEYVKASRG